MVTREAGGAANPPVAPDLGDAHLNATISAGLARAEERLTAVLVQGEDFLTDKISHLARAGGKRFRVVFALIAAQFGPRAESAEVVDAAVVVELTHLATLYHDDVMDEADRRRGAKSANARWNNSIAILAGDYLFAVASDMMADLGVETVRHSARTFRELVTGQMRETVGAAPGVDPVDHYMEVIQEKTGVLIASAGYLGSKHAGATEEESRALQQFGRYLGQVFQIVDDIIDVWSPSEESGKTPGTDLREGVFTLPVLYALQEDSPGGARLREILTGPVSDDALVAEALELIRASAGRERAEHTVERYRQLGEEQLAKLPAGPAADGLRHLMDFALRRLG
ncbi:polyprenyl synthetase family protein [Corynebacterium heidelbergense]|uniref:Geranylgeranyl pyrophosphate synthase n=1 Tax=Corynebacterium heidelbergense TaxID=2055947 RepID=A0A364VDK0_9CORY|nr:polyprenyl synthetase family protein [Corynebacterium heidelbergense]RAV34701.1 geranylgeranyl pyrophosphate synthase [Corynebacterium heidelbergense]WCZ37364.1 Heptaprenyl diphosphate synthase component 2 [Corynebacterium heidelbergense]